MSEWTLRRREVEGDLGIEQGDGGDDRDRSGGEAVGELNLTRRRGAAEKKRREGQAIVSEPKDYVIIDTVYFGEWILAKAGIVLRLTSF